MDYVVSDVVCHDLNLANDITDELIDIVLHEEFHQRVQKLKNTM